MFWKFWSWRDISVPSNATRLKIVPNNIILIIYIYIVFFYTKLWRVLCYLKEQQEIFPETAIPPMHWPMKQTVHFRDLTIQERAVSAIRFHGCSMFMRRPLCPVQMANFLYDLGSLGHWMYGNTTVSYK